MKLTMGELGEIIKEFLGRYFFLICCGVAISFLINLIPLPPSNTQLAHDTCDLSCIIKDETGNVLVTHPFLESMEDEAFQFYSNLGEKPTYVSCDYEGEPGVSVINPETDKVVNTQCIYSCWVQFEPNNFSAAITLPISLTRKNDRKEIEDWKKSMEE